MQLLVLEAGCALAEMVLGRPYVAERRSLRGPCLAAQAGLLRCSWAAERVPELG